MPVFGSTAIQASTLGPLVGLSYNGPPDGIRPGNQLVRVVGQTVAPALLVQFWDGTAWRDKPIDIRVGGSALAGWTAASISINRPERVSVRYEFGEANGGLVTLDVSIRRGERGIRCKLSRHLAATLGLQSGVAMTELASRMTETAADANGHKLVFVSPRSYTATEGSGRMEKAAVKSFVFFVGLERSGAPAGDTAADIASQALASLTESVGVVRR